MDRWNFRPLGLGLARDQTEPTNRVCSWTRIHEPIVSRVKPIGMRVNAPSMSSILEAFRC